MNLRSGYCIEYDMFAPSWLNEWNNFQCEGDRNFNKDVREPFQQFIREWEENVEYQISAEWLTAFLLIGAVLLIVAVGLYIYAWIRHTETTARVTLAVLQWIVDLLYSLLWFIAWPFAWLYKRIFRRRKPKVKAPPSTVASSAVKVVKELEGNRIVVHASRPQAKALDDEDNVSEEVDNLDDYAHNDVDDDNSIDEPALDAPELPTESTRSPGQVSPAEFRLDLVTFWNQLIAKGDRRELLAKINEFLDEDGKYAESVEEFGARTALEGFRNELMELADAR